MKDPCEIAVQPLDGAEEREEPGLGPFQIVEWWLARLFGAVCLSMSLILSVLIGAATLMRYVFKTDLYGYEEWVKLFAFWLYFSGAAYGSLNRTHVSADIVNSYVPQGPLKRLLVALKDLVTVGVSGLFVYYGYDFFMFGFRGPLGNGIAIPMTTVWRIPLWTSYGAIFGGLVFMTLFFARDLVISLRALLGSSDGGDGQ
ncbi:TRAP-type C4-dicarboxylate transport system small permease component-like protein [Thermanaerovibrio acidaminovorans DSM 6589]|uniref:TRAP-type C4-dicarboxylate transport system small permease component-like protein n=1 Tax=Thermanaerovibrio acidaminovorans (strain ATCC 49978 / DSM 6589 / Su883) TaxID=525903 RepID=D1B6N1_THEAS|nr:TRAP transporter small permease [Thermanaerovibrio acidaminovorans]ACZ19672.1 TRAP-type C4-dicarboxylate transport system small permease component-like protein [Thermanaerovibrio acidaminovorans DSM 6589]